jgi:hypothetical protein
MIFGPKSDGTYVVEFRTAKGQVLTAQGRSVPLGLPRERRLLRTNVGSRAPRCAQARSVPLEKSGAYCIDTRRR